MWVCLIKGETIMNETKSNSNIYSKKSFWIRIADWLISPSVSLQEVGARRQAQLLASMTLTIGLLNTVGILFTPGREVGRNFSLIMLSVLLFIAYGLSRTKFYQIGSWLVVIAISFSAFYLATLPDSNAQSILLTFIPLAFALGIGLLSQLGLIILIVANTVLSFMLPILIPTIPSQDVFGAAGIIFTLGSLLIIVNAVQLSVEKSRREELIKINTELLVLQGGLEKRVAERTQALSSVAEISTAASTILESDELLQKVVDLSKERFGFYHAHIYLLNEAGDTLVLASGAGEVGRQMVAEGRAIPLNQEQSLVTRAAREKKGVIVNDVTLAPDFLPNPMLPDTRSELAVPMIVGENVIGVFDVQSDVVGRFTDADISIQTTLAYQVASTVKNARQYHESMQFKLGIENSGDAVFATDVNGTIIYANPAFEKVYGYTPAEVIGKNPRIIKSGVLSSENYQAFWGALLAKKAVTGEIVNKHKDGRLIYIAGTNSAIVNDAGVITGFLAVHHDVTEQKQNQNLATQRAHQQEAINLITQKIQSATTIEEAMQVAARELGHALGQRQTLVALNPSALVGESKVIINE
jgi:PAS domain S-box-containing protein